MELTLLKIKTFFQKLWSFIKLYFKELIFVFLLFYSFFLVKKKTDLINQLLQERETVRQAHRQNLDNLVANIEAEQARRRKIESDFRDLIEKINKEHQEEVKRIATVRAEEVKKLIEQHQNNPVKMAETINTLFGIPVMSIPEQRQSWEPQ